MGGNICKKEKNVLGLASRTQKECPGLNNDKMAQFKNSQKIWRGHFAREDTQTAHSPWEMLGIAGHGEPRVNATVRERACSHA